MILHYRDMVLSDLVVSDDVSSRLGEVVFDSIKFASAKEGEAYVVISVTDEDPDGIGSTTLQFKMRVGEATDLSQDLTATTQYLNHMKRNYNPNPI